MNYDLPLFKNTEKNGTGFIPVSEEQYNRTRELLIRLLTPMDESERLNFSRVTQNFLNLYKDVIDANNISPVYVASVCTGLPRTGSEFRVSPRYSNAHFCRQQTHRYFGDSGKNPDYRKSAGAV
jgi:hypothetical protein